MIILGGFYIDSDQRPESFRPKKKTKKGSKVHSPIQLAVLLVSAIQTRNKKKRKERLQRVPRVENIARFQIISYQQMLFGLHRQLHRNSLSIDAYR